VTMNEEAVPDVAASFVSKLCSAVIPAGDADVNNTTTAGSLSCRVRAHVSVHVKVAE
jgi:hypothetical protein